MGDLVCPHCDPVRPGRGRQYYPVERIVLSDEDGMVGIEGTVFRSDHTIGSLTIYAECSRCGTVLTDKRDQSVDELMEAL